MLNDNAFETVDAKQMVSIFSCFTNVNVSDEQKSFKPNTKDTSIKKIVDELTILYTYYQDFETENNTFTGVDYNIHYDLIDYVYAWTNCESAAECKALLQSLETNNKL